MEKLIALVKEQAEYIKFLENSLEKLRNEVEAFKVIFDDTEVDMKTL